MRAMSDARRNLLAIADPDALALAEGEYARVRIAQLQKRPVKGAFDVAHLRAINQHIFQDVYPDAGELRSVRGQWSKGRAFDDDLIAAEKDLRLASRIIYDVNKSGATLRNYIERGLVLGRTGD